MESGKEITDTLSAEDIMTYIDGDTSVDLLRHIASVVERMAKVEEPRFDARPSVLHIIMIDSGIQQIGEDTLVSDTDTGLDDESAVLVLV